MIWRYSSLITSLTMLVVSCSNPKDKFSFKEITIVSPDGHIYKSEQDWQQNTKGYSLEYRQLHARAISTAQDWKRYILDIFPQAQEKPPGSVKSFRQTLSGRSFILYADFLNTGKPTAVFVETMPNLPTIATLIVSQWEQDRWEDILTMDEKGLRNAYMDPDIAYPVFKGFTIKIREDALPDGKIYFNFAPNICSNFADSIGCTVEDRVGWDNDRNRYCFAEIFGEYEYCDQKEYEKVLAGLENISSPESNR